MCFREILCQYFKQSRSTRRKRTGPKPLPWGTPQSRSKGLDSCWLMNICCFLTEKYDSNHVVASPPIPWPFSRYLAKSYGLWCRTQRSDLIRREEILYISIYFRKVELWLKTCHLTQGLHGRLLTVVIPRSLVETTSAFMFFTFCHRQKNNNTGGCQWGGSFDGWR